MSIQTNEENVNERETFNKLFIRIPIASWIVMLTNSFLELLLPRWLLSDGSFRDVVILTWNHEANERTKRPHRKRQRHGLHQERSCGTQTNTYKPRREASSDTGSDAFLLDIWPPEPKENRLPSLEPFGVLSAGADYSNTNTLLTKIIQPTKLGSGGSSGNRFENMRRWWRGY